MSDVKVKRWKSIVEALKVSPDFGVHGCKHYNLRAILQERQFMFGHYFAVGEEQKKLSNEEFYEKLWNSIYVALGHSSSLEIKDGKVKLMELPCLIIGVDKIQDGRRFIDPNAMPRPSLNGDTFPIGHDFLLNYIDIIPYWMNMREISRISKKVERVSAERKYSLDIDKSFFAVYELVGRVITGIHRAIEGYQSQRKLKAN